MIFFSDVDDTIMQNGVPSEELIQFLIKINKSDNLFIPCSGRPTSNLIKTFTEFGSKYAIGFNGGEIYDLIGKKTIFKKSISKDLVEEVITYLKSLGLDYVLYDDEKLYTNNLNNEYSNVEKELTMLDIEESQNAIESIKILGLADPEVIDLHIKDLKAKFSNLEVTKSKPFFIEITKKGVTKGNTIEEFVTKLNEEIKNVYIFGDSNNDLSMFKTEATKVAVANAQEEILNLADEVCESCENSGVIKYINKIMEEK